MLEKNAWGIVKGIEETPASDKILQIKDYESCSSSALALIYRNNEREFCRIIEIIDCLKLGHRKLQTHFHPDKRESKGRFFSEIFACQLGADEYIDLFAARLQMLAHQLNARK